MANHNSRETILSCALSLFSQRGYHAVGVSEIVEAASVTKPTLYYFFGSKEGLFRELLKTGFAGLEEGLRAACRYEPHPDDYDRDVYPVLLEMVRTIFRCAQTHPDFYLMWISLMFAPLTSEPTKWALPCYTVQNELLEGVFRQMSAVHKNLRGRESMITWGFLGAVNVQIVIWRRGHGGLGDDVARAVVRQFMHGIF